MNVEHNDFPLGFYHPFKRYESWHFMVSYEMLNVK